MVECSAAKTLGKSPFAQAIRFVLGCVPTARGYLDHGFLSLDINAAERTIKTVVIGGKNRIFPGSQGGRNAMIIAYT
ncbi:transposase [Roseobacter sp.]|uniref:IS66 family transposase n=1 Tax=Roseobacter sp. TaxID=1907202 RepID=UPI003859EFC2